MRTFYKYSGSGNDFIFVDNRENDFSLKPSQVVEWCKRREGIGADGVVLLGSSKDSDFSLRIFNSDGSEAEMCGNATRCAVHLAHHHLKMKPEPQYQIETMNGTYTGEVVNSDEIKIKMTELFDVGAITIDDLGSKNALYLNTGVPHAVIQVSSVEDVKVKRVGSAIRNDVRFPSGTNVDFFEVIDPNAKTLKLRVYERGVEDETLCCGTGVMATAVACSKFFNWTGEITIFAKGGTLKAIVDESLRDLYFQGKVSFIFAGTLK